MVTETDIKNQIGVILSLVDSEVSDAEKEVISLRELINGLPNNQKRMDALEKVKELQKNIKITHELGLSGFMEYDLMVRRLRSGISEIASIFK